MATIYRAEEKKSAGSLGYTGKPVVDQSAATEGAALAGLVETAGTTALSAHKEIKVAELQKDLEGDIDNFFDRRATIAAAEGEMFGSPDEDSLVSQDDPMIREAREEAASLIAAAKAGSMSTTELKLHLDTKWKMRNQNFPGYADDFRKIYGQVMSDNQLRLSIIEAQEKIDQKSMVDMDKTIRTEAMNLGIPGFMTADLDSLAMEIADINGSATAYTRYMNDDKMAKVEGAKGYQKSERGRVELFKLDLQQQVQSFQQEFGRELSREEFNLKANEYLDTYMNTQRTVFGDTVSNEMYGQTRQQLEDYISDMDKVMAGEMSLDQLNNRNEMITSTLTNEMLRNPSVARIVSAGKAFGPEVTQFYMSHIAESPEGARMFSDISSFIFYGGGFPPNMPTDVPGYQDALKSITDYSLAAISADWDSLSQEDRETALKFTSAMSGILGMDRPVYTPEEADAMLKFAASDGFYGAVTKSTEMNPHREKVTNGVSRFVGDISDDITQKLNMELGQIKVGGQVGRPNPNDLRLSVKDAVTMSFDAEGFMTFSVNEGAVKSDPELKSRVQGVVNKFNKGYANRYNNSVRAAAHASGHKDYRKASNTLRTGVNFTTANIVDDAAGATRFEVQDIIDSTSNPSERISKLQEKGITPSSGEIAEVLGVAGNEKAVKVLNDLTQGADPNEIIELYGDDEEVLGMIRNLYGVR